MESLKERERQATSTGGSNPHLMETFPQAEKRMKTGKPDR